VIFISLPFALFLSLGSQASSPQNLSLGDVLRDVDAAFPKLVSARLEADIANAKLQEKRGAFDPIFSVENDFLRYNSATSPGKLRQTSLTETSVEVLNRSGIKLAFGARYNTGVLKSPASSTGTLGEYFVSAKIPLLRDRLSNAKFIAERQAILGEPLAQQAVREARLSLFEKAGFVYWEWEGAGEKLKIANEILELAVARAAYIRRRVDEGANPAIDIQEADAEVFRRQGSRDKAERDLQKAEFKLQFFQWNAEGVALNLPPSRTLLQPCQTIQPRSRSRLLSAGLPSRKKIVLSFWESN
jgi:outer membrane protein TolC